MTDKTFKTEEQINREHADWVDNKVKHLLPYIETMVEKDGRARLPINGMNDRKIQEAVVAELQKKGFTVKMFTGIFDPENPELGINSKILVTK